jgi:hypothetical protein
MPAAKRTKSPRSRAVAEKDAEVNIEKKGKKQVFHAPGTDPAERFSASQR